MIVLQVTVVVLVSVFDKIVDYEIYGEKTMSHTITYNSEAHIVEIKVQEDLLLSEAKEILSETARAIKEHNCFLTLTDMREATNKLSILEIYKLPELLSAALASLEINLHRMRRAIVVEKDLKDYNFFETVTINRAQYAKLFFDIDEAKKWLLEK